MTNAPAIRLKSCSQASRKSRRLHIPFRKGIPKRSHILVFVSHYVEPSSFIRGPSIARCLKTSLPSFNELHLLQLLMSQTKSFFLLLLLRVVKHPKFEQQKKREKIGVSLLLTQASQTLLSFSLFCSVCAAKTQTVIAVLTKQ